MRTGDGETEDTGALTHEENVIRLPRDWLGPPEELVPIGPAARARAAQRELDGGTPPTADAFWSEDSAALHDAVQAPAPSTRAHVGPPVGLVPPLAGQRLRTLNRRPRLRLGGARPSRWWGVAAVPIVALVVAAIIGTSESPASHPATAHGSIPRADGAVHRGSVAPSDAERLASASKAAFAAAATGLARERAIRRQHRPVRRPHARTRVSTRHTTPGHVAAAHRSTGSPAPTVTEAAAAPPSTQASAPTPTPSSSGASATSTGSTGSTASAGGARGSTPSTGPAGPTRIGSVTGGCSPKCS